MKEIYQGKQIFWSIEEVKSLITLRSKGHTFKEISIILNDKFNTYRTSRACSRKYEDEHKQSYSEKVDRIIISNVRKYPANLQYSFEVSSLEIYQTTNLKVTKLSIQGRYYGYIRLNYNVINVGSSENGFTINVKNKSKIKTQPKLTPIQGLIKEILNLSDKDKELIINILKN
jgi:hypothetical protein